MDPSADAVIEVFETAAEENNVSSLRKGQTVNLPEEGDVWMTGDLHDHRSNFSKLVRFANLAENPDRHLVLHELIHGDHYDANGAEDSWRTLFRAAELKCEFAGQVHFLLANHDLAQIHGEGIMKAGLSVCEAFTEGVKRDFADRGDAVNVAITEFLLSLPLAIRCPNGLFFCHSLPTDANVVGFDYSVFDRPLEGKDYLRRVGPVYQLIWGRNMTAATADRFADKVGARILVTGHQPQESGFAVNGERHLIIASDHNQGVFLPLELNQTYDMAQLVDRLHKFVAIDLEPES
ncbi:MAG: metallophosphoesterase [Tepidisphaeraceae bacterium]